MRPVPRGGLRLLSSTIRMTRTASAMHAHEMRPIQLICFVAEALPTALLRGSFSGILPALGREISLDEDGSELEVTAARLEASLETPLEEDAGFFDEEGFFEDEGFFEEDAGVEEDETCYEDASDEIAG